MELELVRGESEKSTDGRPEVVMSVALAAVG